MYFNLFYFFNTFFFFSFFYSIKNIICEEQISKENQKEYPKVKQLISGEYLLILNDGIYIYDKDFLNIKKNSNFNSDQRYYNDDDFNKIVISEFIDNNDYFVLCLVKNYIYLF